MPPATGIVNLVIYRRLPQIDLQGHTYYLTCCLHDGRPLLRVDDLTCYLVRLYGESRDRSDILLHGYVVMPDHYHVLFTLSPEGSVSAIVRKAHSLFARYCRRTTPTRGRIWQRRFYDHVIRDEDDWRTKLSYMHGNPVRAGLVEEPSDYPWSSCAFWETGASAITCDGSLW